VTSDPSETDELLRRAAAGDGAVWWDLLGRHRDRLRRLVALRLDHRLQGRIDASDVIQEACVEAWERLADYLRDPKMPFYLWLRFLAVQKLVTLHRHHGFGLRDVGREVALAGGETPEASSAALAAQLLGHGPTPSEAAARAELRAYLRDALNRLDPLDREVLALRHFEHLSRAESAQVLGIQESAAGKRYVRALKRLRQILAGGPGGLKEFLP
jgi:RNA polymerase sigma-70 factor (ECF subfamily)